jgi:hypothetical protein
MNRAHDQCWVLNPEININTIEPLGSSCPWGGACQHTRKPTTQILILAKINKKNIKLYKINTLENKKNNKKSEKTKKKITN